MELLPSRNRVGQRGQLEVFPRQPGSSLFLSGNMTEDLNVLTRGHTTLLLTGVKNSTKEKRRLNLSALRSGPPAVLRSRQTVFLLGRTESHPFARRGSHRLFPFSLSL
jgi:hypothetical protein